MSKNIRRKSVDPNKTPLSFLNQKHKNATELQVRLAARNEESQSSLSNHSHQQYPADELPRIFNVISKGSNTINCQSLYSLLKEQGYGDNLYSAVEMIALVDHQRKGYITEKEFINYFTDKNHGDQEKVPPLSEEMERKKRWVQEIDKNVQYIKHYQEKEYCLYVADKLKEEIQGKKKETIN